MQPSSFPTATYWKVGRTRAEDKCGVVGLHSREVEQMWNCGLHEGPERRQSKLLLFSERYITIAA